MGRHLEALNPLPVGQSSKTALPTSAEELVARAVGPAFAVDLDDRVVGWNEALAGLLGHDGANAVGQPIVGLLQTRDIFGNPILKLGETFFETMSQGKAVRPFEMDVQHAAGRRCRVGVSVVVIQGARSCDHRLVFFLTPVMRRRRADEAIERLLRHSDVEIGDVADLASTIAEAEARPRLTGRQHQVLSLIAHGMSAHQIANELKISVHTVRNHVQNILRCFDAQSQLEAVAKAMAAGMLTKRSARQNEIG